MAISARKEGRTTQKLRVHFNAVKSTSAMRNAKHLGKPTVHVGTRGR